MAVEVRYDATAQSAKFLMRQVILGVVRSPSADFGICLAEAITNMFDSWKERQGRFITPSSHL